MTHYYDDYGWLTETQNSERRTSTEPPAHGNAPTVGKLWPNFISQDAGWTEAVYSLPPIPDTRPAQRAAIQDQLDAIDTKSESPRARRESALGNTTYLASLDAQAAILRKQLQEI